MSEVTLTAGIRANLVNLQKTNSVLSRTQTRLSTGKEVNSAVDNPSSFFAAANLTDRANGLSSRLDSMGQAIQTVKSADAGITAIRSVLSQMKGVVNDALANTDSSSRVDLGKQFNELIRQVGSISSDSGYAGINLLNYQEESASADTQQKVEVQFNESINVSTLVITGFDISASDSELDSSTGEMTAAQNSAGTAADITGVTVADQTGSTAALVIRNQAGDAVGIKSFGTDNTAATGHEVNWGADATYKADLADVIKSIEKFDDQLQTESKKLANNLNVVTIRQDFTNSMINTLTEGADALTLADLNEEGANLLALQTSQSLGVNALSLASQSAQSVLQLVG
jgi:flagellin-like hook-associated protein FlgL